MKVEQSSSKIKTISIFMIILMLMFAGTLLSGCKKTVTSLTMEIENKQTSYNPGDTITFTFKANTKISEDDITLIITDGEDYAIIDGLTLQILEDATFGATVSVQAQYGEILSNIITIEISHIEAEEITITSTDSQLYAGQIYTLSATYYPSNATRTLEYEIVSDDYNIATLNNNKLSISSDASAGATVTIVAKMGNVISEEITYTIVSTSDYTILGVEFITTGNKTLTIDTTTSGTSVEIEVQAIALYNNNLIYFTTSLPTLSVEENNGIIEIDSNGINKINLLSSGTTTLKATYGELTDTLTITVKMPPTQVLLPENFEDDATNYNYAVNEAITFNLNVDGDNGTTDYIITIGGDIEATITGNTTTNEWTSTNENITYSGTEITFNKTGSYTIQFSSNTGCVKETSSSTLTLTINNGTNVSSKEDFITAFEDSSITTINLTGNIIFANGCDTLTSYGNKSIYGNGFTIDCSKQLTEAQTSGYGTNAFLTFNIDSNNANGYYEVNIEDLTITGNIGLLSESDFAKWKGVTEEYVQEKIKAGDCQYFTYSGPYLAIKLTGTSSSYCVPYLNNVTISTFSCGISLERCIDEAALNDGDGKYAVNNLSIYNLLGDGLLNRGSQIYLGDSYFGSIGSTPYQVHSDNSDAAGVNGDEAAYIVIAGEIDCENFTTFDSIYLQAQMYNNIELIAEQFGGLDGIIKTLLNWKLTELVNTYKDVTISKQIQNAVTNVYYEDANGNWVFNLMCISTSGTEALFFSEGNEALIGDIDDNFFISGIDTTHKYLRLNAYELLSSIKSLDTSLLENYVDVLKNVEVILVNYNYAG